LARQIDSHLKRAQQHDTDCSVRQAIEPLQRMFDPASDAARYINFILSGRIEQEYAGSVSDLSAHWFNHVEEFEGADVLFAEGFRTIVEFLASDLKIELGQVVQRIEWSPGAVRVVTQTDEFAADRVVVTLPLGVLKAQRVRFVPQLPRNKQPAIDTLGFGVLNKCYLRFDEVFWPDDVDWMEYISADHGAWTEWLSFQRGAGIPVLLGFHAAERGSKIETWSDQQIVASGMQTLKTIFGGAIPEPVDYQITRWAADPYALGSYSYNSVGSTPRMRNELAAPLDNILYFAGEATERDYFGTAHGAYLSGLRVTQEIASV